MMIEQRGPEVVAELIRAELAKGQGGNGAAGKNAHDDGALDENEDAVPGTGKGGAPVHPEMQRKGEAALGVSLSDVRVHKNDNAAAALGAKAFTHGQNIVLGAGVDNDANPVMAHEVAHTVQQKGAAPAVAKKSLRGPSSSAHERDADDAAAKMMLGLPATVEKAGAERVQCFEGGEHMQLGTEGFEHAGIKGGLTVGKVTAEPGLFTALQGDFYGGSWSDLEADCTDKPDGVYKLLGVLTREQGLRAAHYADPAHNKEPDSDGAIIIASFGLRAKYLEYASDNASHFGEKSPAAEKKFEQLKDDNPAYAAEIGTAEANFGANVAEYLRLHMDALGRAHKDACDRKPADVALAMDAGATLFLTDAFASGHMRTPRDAMKTEYAAVFHARGRQKVEALVDEHIPDEIDVPAALGLGVIEAHLPDGARPPPLLLASVKAHIKASLYPIVDSLSSKLAEQAANFGAKSLHDADNQGGLKVHNARGGRWTATGDHALKKEEENVKIAEEAVGASAKHTKVVYEMCAAKGKDAPIPFVSMKPILDLLPMIDPDNAPQQDWHWDSASPAFKLGIVNNMKGAVAGTIESAADAVKQQVADSARKALQATLAALGTAGHFIAEHLEALVEWLVEKMPRLPPDVWINSIML
jgi:hypothetical protein